MKSFQPAQDTLIKDHLLRRLRVNYVAYAGQTGTTDEWLDGYDQAIKDCAAFIKQMQTFSGKD